MKVVVLELTWISHANFNEKFSPEQRKFEVNLFDALRGKKFNFFFIKNKSGQSKSVCIGELTFWYNL